MKRKQWVTLKNSIHKSVQGDREMKFEWRDENDTEWLPVDTDMATHKEVADYLIAKYYIPEGEHEHRYTLAVRDVETKAVHSFNFTFSIAVQFY
jgi:hypothetical protein